MDISKQRAQRKRDILTCELRDHRQPGAPKTFLGETLSPAQGLTFLNLPSGIKQTKSISFNKSVYVFLSAGDRQQAPKASLSPDEFFWVPWPFLLRLLPPAPDTVGESLGQDASPANGWWSYSIPGAVSWPEGIHSLGSPARLSLHTMDIPGRLILWRWGW